ncbi:restriction endonuclease subunit S [Xylanibacter ruminicola]|uniref:restriction endonuclease subunit S n=1 Tax=Xylanibacter ruminicola TaxID=839 RepID=UPI00048AFD6A|nr:restriction endonuclease subunit S [Xylanibacter ruminicola]
MGSKIRIVRLGDYIEQCDDRNEALTYGLDAVRGVSNTKLIQKTKANMTGRNLSTFHVVSKNHFVFNRRTTRNGERLGLGFNNTDSIYIFTEDYVHFKVSDESILNPTYLYLFFLRDEFDRLVRYHSWGSATEFFNWEDMQRVYIPLPSAKEQEKVVNAWKALREIKEQNEAKAAPLMQLCQSYIQELKHKYPLQEIGPYIEEYDLRNKDSIYNIDDVRGISIEKKIIDTKANMDGVKLTPYKIFKHGTFCYVTITSRNSDKITLSLNPNERDYIVSSSYITFKVKDEDKTVPEFLYLWFCRSEFDRYARFNSWGSAREAFSFEDMKRTEIPLPPPDVQRAIVNIYKCANEAKQIAAEADRLSREVCPALIQHTINN